MKLSTLLLSLFFSLMVSAAEPQLPELSSPVMDLAGMLSQNDIEDLTALATEINSQNGPQITILTVHNLQGTTIEDFSIRVAQKWQLGTKERDNGILVVIAREERSVRIEVGQGLEGDFTDLETAKYTREIFPEYFKQGNFHGGLRIFMQDMAAKFHIKLGNSANFIRKNRGPSIPSWIIPLFIFTIIIGRILRGVPTLSGIFTGTSFAIIGLIIGLPVIILVFTFIFGFMLGLSGFRSDQSYGRSGYYGGSSWGGSSGGGWSGGGGGFSGGGSSGRW